MLNFKTLFIPQIRLQLIELTSLRMMSINRKRLKIFRN